MRTLAGSAFTYSADVARDVAEMGRHRVGHCPRCKCGVATTEPRVRSIVCPVCSYSVTSLRTIDGTTTAHKCDPACIWATGTHCECGCGGANHGIGHIRDIDDIGRAEYIARIAATYAATADGFRSMFADNIEDAFSADSDEWWPIGVFSRDELRMMFTRDLIATFSAANLSAYDDAVAGNAPVLSNGKPGKYCALSVWNIRKIVGHVISGLTDLARGIEDAAREAEMTPVIEKTPLTLTGTIKATSVGTSYFTYYGETTFRMLLETPEGWEVWMTIPAKLRDVIPADASLDYLKGKVVKVNVSELTAYVGRDGKTNVNAKRPSFVALDVELTPAVIREPGKKAPGIRARKTVKVEPVKVEPVKVEPVKVEPVKVEPVTAPTMLPSSARTYPMMDGTVYGIETPDGESATITRDGIVIAVCPVATALEIISLTRSRIRDTYPEWARTPERFSVVPETPAAETEEPPAVSEPAPVVPETTPVTVHEEPTTEAIRSRFAEIITYGLMFSHRP